MVGGQDAEEGQAPFQCSMQVNKQHYCGCAIISSKFLLTAAHCYKTYYKFQIIPQKNLQYENWLRRFILFSFAVAILKSWWAQLI